MCGDVPVKIILIRSSTEMAVPLILQSSCEGKTLDGGSRRGTLSRARLSTAGTRVCVCRGAEACLDLSPPQTPKPFPSLPSLVPKFSPLHLPKSSSPTVRPQVLLFPQTASWSHLNFLSPVRVLTRSFPLMKLPSRSLNSCTTAGSRQPTLTRRRDHPQSCCSASRTSWLTLRRRRMQIEDGVTRRSRDRSLPPRRTQRSSPGFEGGACRDRRCVTLSCFPIGRWSDDVTNRRREQCVAVRATAINTGEARGLASRPPGNQPFVKPPELRDSLFSSLQEHRN